MLGITNETCIYIGGVDEAPARSHSLAAVGWRTVMAAESKSSIAPPNDIVDLTVSPNGSSDESYVDTHKRKVRLDGGPDPERREWWRAVDDDEMS